MGILRRAAREKKLVGVWNQEADESQRDHVEEGDPPEHLLNRSRESLAGVGRLGRSQTDQLSTSEGKGSVDKDTAKTLETVVEGAWIDPGLSAPVASLGATATVDDDSEETRDKRVSEYRPSSRQSSNLLT